MTKKLALVGLVGAAFALGVYMGISSGHTSPQYAVEAPEVATRAASASVAPVMGTQVSAAVAMAEAADPTRAAPSTVWNQFQPDRITLPVAGTPLIFRANSIQTQADGRTVWVGQSEETDGIKLVATGTGDRFNAVVYTTGGAEVHYSIHNGKTTVQEYSPDNPGGCPVAVIPTGAAALAPAAVPVMAGDVYIVKVLYVYTTAAAAARGGADAARAAFVNRLDTANQILADSGVNNVRFAAVDGATLLDFTPDKDKKMSTALTAVSLSATVDTDRKKKEKRADFVTYEVAVSEASDFPGLAFMPTNPAYNTSFSVVNTAADAKGMLHEMAHCFGCDHDRAHASEDHLKTEATYGAYNYGFTFGPSNGSGTIMSYAGNRVAYFSNPAITFEGTPLGIAAGQTNAADNVRWIREKAAAASVILSANYTPAITTQPLGQTISTGGTITLSVVASVAAGTTEDPKPAGADTLSYQWRKDSVDIPGATSATYTKSSAAVSESGGYTVYISNNQGATLSLNATVVVNPAGAPVITTQPATKTITAGDTLTLSVVATGESITYQWYQEGYPLTGATSATYTKTNAGSGDAGRYFVILKNSLGTTPSDLATVTVNAKPYSSGGGGAPSLWFLGMLTALAGIRLVRRTK